MNSIFFSTNSFYLDIELNINDRYNLNYIPSKKSKTKNYFLVKTLKKQLYK